MSFDKILKEIETMLNEVKEIYNLSYRKRNYNRLAIIKKKLIIYKNAFLAFKNTLLQNEHSIVFSNREAYLKILELLEINDKFEESSNIEVKNIKCSNITLRE